MNDNHFELFQQLLEKHGLWEKYYRTDSFVMKGWHPLLDELFTDLISMGWNKELFQVKEKFGSLRMYINESTDEMSARISKAEKDSQSICECCGKPGKLITKGWMQTLCEGCEK